MQLQGIKFYIKSGTKQITMKKITGIGGIFFKCTNPKKMIDWYTEHLGMTFPNEVGGIIQWRQREDQDAFGHTVWGPFRKNTNYFEPSTKEFMINYRVENLVKLLKELKNSGVEIIGEIEEYDFGKFGWILDPEGNKIELWEPNDVVFQKVNNIEWNNTD